MASSWLVLCEVDGTLALSSGETVADAERMAHAALVAPEKVRAAAAGVIKLDHSLRAAQVITYKRGGRELIAVAEEAKAPPSTIAYDILIPFGYDIDRDLKLGNQPPPEKLNAFVQKLNIPIVLAKKTEAPAKSGPAKPVVTNAATIAEEVDKRRQTLLIATVVVLVLVVVGVVFVFKAL